MDGTLTQAVIDFAEMRRRVAAVGGLDSLNGDILAIIASWPPAQQAAAHAEIAAVEADALQRMQLMPGVLRLSSFLDASRVPRAIVTRNVNCEQQRSWAVGAAAAAAPVQPCWPVRRAVALRLRAWLLSRPPLAPPPPSPPPLPSTRLQPASTSSTATTSRCRPLRPPSPASLHLTNQTPRRCCTLPSGGAWSRRSCA